MKIYLINLDKDKERFARAKDQLTGLGFTFERISAVNGKALSKVEASRAYDHFRWWCAIGRPIRIGEIGCALSHFKIYRKMLANGDKSALILEDDVILGAGFVARLQEVERFVDPAKSQVVLLSNHTGKSPTNNGIIKCSGDRHSESYVLTSMAARSLLDVNYPIEAPCDYWDRWVKKGAIELYHAFPSVCSPNEEEFSSNIAPKGVLVVSELSKPMWLVHKMKRIIGKIIDCCWIVAETVFHKSSNGTGDEIKEQVND